MANPDLFDLYKDGKLILNRVSFIEMVRYIHRCHNYSFSHATTFEGYSYKESF